MTTNTVKEVDSNVASAPSSSSTKNHKNGREVNDAAGSIGCMFTSTCGDYSSERVCAHLQRRRGDWVITECPQARRIKNVDGALFDEGYDADEKNGPFYDAVQK